MADETGMVTSQTVASLNSYIQPYLIPRLHPKNFQMRLANEANKISETINTVSPRKSGKVELSLQSNISHGLTANLESKFCNIQATLLGLIQQVMPCAV